MSVWKCLSVHVINKYDWTEIPSAAAKYCASGTHYMGQSHISQHQTFCSASVLFSLLLNCGSKLAVKSSWKNLFGWSLFWWNAVYKNTSVFICARSYRQTCLIHVRVVKLWQDKNQQHVLNGGNESFILKTSVDYLKKNQKQKHQFSCRSKVERIKTALINCL